jgi:Ca2+-binding RTX toxin-like protein
LAFETIRGASQIDFIGTAEVDVLVAFNEELPMVVKGRAANDNITFVQAVTAITRNASVQGGQGNDTITPGNLATSNLNGNLGGDTFLLGGAIISGSTISGGQGSDTINGPDNLVTSILNGNQDNDTINFAGVASSASIVGGQGNDTLNFTGFGAISDTVINGNDGTDFLNFTGFGAAGAVLLTNVTISGGQGGDTLDALGGRNGSGSTGFILSGNLGNDSLQGSAQDDTLLGGEGNDTVTAGDGDDQVTGGLGSDTYGGDAAGETTYIIESISDSAATTSGTVQGFDDFITAGSFGNDEVLDISAVSAALAGGALDPGVGTVVGAFNVATAANFTELKAALDGSGVDASSGADGIEVTVVTVAAGALAGEYVWVNDNQAAYNVGDLMFSAFNNATATRIANGINV